MTQSPNHPVTQSPNHDALARDRSGSLALTPTRRTVLGSANAPPSARGRHEYECTFIKAGRPKYADQTPSRWLIPASTLELAVDQFDARPCYVDHTDLWTGPQVKNLAGVTFEPRWDPDLQAITGGLRLYDEDPNSPGALVAALLDQLLADQQVGLAVPPLGLSAVFYHDPEWDEAAGITTTSAIRYVESVDIVYAAAAGGAVKRALAALRVRAGLRQSGAIPMPPEQRASECVPTSVPQIPTLDPNTPPVDPIAQAVASLQAVAAELRAGLDKAGQMATQAPDVVPDIVATDPAALAPTQITAWEAIDARLTLMEQAAATREEIATVVGMGEARQRLFAGRTGLDQVSAALEALLEGQRPADGIQPLSGLKELYMLLSGDYEMAGVFHGDRVALANVTCATMASLTANALNKRVMNLFQTYPRWWAPIVQEQDFGSLQAVKWITLGGVGELPTVAEGASYTEMTWDDAYEEDTFVKKGGYLGLTLEAIDKDDTARLRAAPQALAQAAWLTLSKQIASMFTYAGTGGLGYDLEDSKALFHADHSNYGTTALSWTAWNSTRQLMRDQAELNSSEPLGALTAPRYLLVPNELEVSGLQILASDGEPGTADNDINPWAQGASHDALIAAARSRVIVIDFWTDANNWAAICDPRLYPTIGLGYRYGRTPELFSVASPTAGLMFSNDTMPIKVRFFYVLGAIDYRGMYLHKVT